MKAIKSETINSYWRKICPDDFIGFKTKAVKKIMKEILDIRGKKVGMNGFKTKILEKLNNRHCTRGINRRQFDKYQLCQNQRVSKKI